MVIPTSTYIILRRPTRIISLCLCTGIILNTVLCSRSEDRASQPNLGGSKHPCLLPLYLSLATFLKLSACSSELSILYIWLFFIRKYLIFYLSSYQILLVCLREIFLLLLLLQILQLLQLSLLT